MSFSGSFKPAINRLVDKASKAYYILRQTFNFNNGCSPRIIQKLFNIMIVPILSYGAEIWACFGWRRQEIRNIKQFIFNKRHSFEKLQSKMCRNALGINKNVPDHLVKAEMGAFPMMGFFIKQVFSYWQHVLALFGKNNLVSEAIHVSILLDRNDKLSYYSRVKAVLSCLDMRNRIYKVHPNEIKRYSNEMSNKFNSLFSIQYFTSMKTTGKTEIYHKIEKNISIWKVFGFKSSTRVKKKFNSN